MACACGWQVGAGACCRSVSSVQLLAPLCPGHPTIVLSESIVLHVRRWVCAGSGWTPPLALDIVDVGAAANSGQVRRHDEALY